METAMTGGAPRLASLSMIVIATACANYGPTSVVESADWSDGTSAHVVAVGALTRTFLVHVPSHRRVSQSGVTLPWPLVIVLHGSGGDAGTIEHQSGMDSVADAQRFLVAYPNGLGGEFGIFPSDWNAGSCCGGAARDNIDDVGFISDLIKTVASHVPLDTRRVYVAGFSAGGYMAYRAGCELSATIAAIGVVSGSLAADSCSPSKPVPLFAIHGTDDPEVSYDEAAPAPPGLVPTLADGLPPAVQFWAALNGCAALNAKGVRSVPATDVVQTNWTSCSSGDVDFYSIAGGTHGWPGGPDAPGALPPMNEINASALMWQFFIRHIR
jgi:polyhydroxybutyrate depolymerase